MVEYNRVQWTCLTQLAMLVEIFVINMQSVLSLCTAQYPLTEFCQTKVFIVHYPLVYRTRNLQQRLGTKL